MAIRVKTRSEIEKLFKKKKLKIREECRLLGCSARVITSALKMEAAR
jgi:hypothetical protein